jgi:menaquinone-9 beta-reductase
MRIKDPLIIGGGPAGSAAAIALAKSGAKPVIYERSTNTGDAICGGFLSWETLEKLETLGVRGLEAHPIADVRLFAGKRQADARLPSLGVGVSRHRLDTIMQRVAVEGGAGIERGVAVREIAGNSLKVGNDTIDAASIFVATGKHDLRGAARPKIETADSTLGLRIKFGPHPKLRALLQFAIELHLFDRGYAGLLLQEDGRANLCLAVRKSRFAQADGKPETLLRQWAEECPALGDRLAFADALPGADAIASVPYGWRATETQAGVFRLGDQAACIPSLAGEGIGIAIASGMAAADAWMEGGPGAAPAFQQKFAARTRRPVAVAKWLWERGETPWSAALAARIMPIAPIMARAFARATRIGD